MVLAILILLCCLLVLVAALTWQHRTPADRLLTEHLLDRYLVTIAAGETFSGLLSAVDGRTVVLTEVRVLTKDGSSAAVDGEVVLRRDSISYMQRPPVTASGA